MKAEAASLLEGQAIQFNINAIHALAMKLHSFSTS